MCGRFTLNTTGREIAEYFGLGRELEFSPRFNIAPTQHVPVVRTPDLETGREAAAMHWGLIPFWADDPSIGNRMINARAETVDEKNSYRVPFSRRRCIVPATGFYEWQPTEGPGGKQPWYIRSAEESLLGFAGLWEQWEDEESGDEIESFTILTGEPNELVADVHDRMPVILDPDDYDFWLDPAMKDEEALKELAQTVYPGEALEAYRVSTHVNNPQNDDPDCLEPLDE